MSARIVIICDGCEAEAKPRDKSLWRLRATMHNDGWRRGSTRGSDLCPACADKARLRRAERAEKEMGYV